MKTKYAGISIKKKKDFARWRRRRAANTAFAMCMIMLSVLSSIKVYAKESATFPHILFLSSYSYDWESVPGQIDGIRETLENQYYIDYLFMDSRNLGEEVSYEITEMKMERFLQNGFKFGGVIAGDDAALHFVMDHWKEFGFDELPVVFEGINDVEVAKKAASEYGMTGIIESFPMKETVEAAEGIYPNATRVLAIVDESISGKGSTAQFFGHQNDFPNLTFETMNTSKLTEEQIREQIAKVSTDTILLYLMCTENADGAVYMMDEAMSMAAESANVPVFRADETGQACGLFGGCLIHYTDMGRQAGSMLGRLLDGVDRSEVPVTTLKGVYQFNKDVMGKYGIKKSQLPKGSELIDFTPSFWDLYRTWILAICFIAVFAALIIIILMYANRKTKNINVKLTETQETMKASIVASDITCFEYYPDRHTAVMQSGKKRWDLADELTNYPDSWMAENITHPDDEEILKNTFAKIEEGAEKAECTIRNRYEDSYGWFKFYFTSIYNDEHKRRKVIVLVTDITKDKEREEIRLELESAKRVNQAKVESLSRVSHDMRTPMNAILGITYLLEEKAENAEQKEEFEQLREAGEYLLQLINDILDVNKAELGKIELHPKICDEEQFFKSVLDLMKPKMKEKNICFHCEMKDIEWSFMKLDEQRVKQIFINLFSNAIKYTPEGGSICFTMELVSRDEKMIRDKFVIRDTGIGMSKEFQAKLFQPFSREERSNVEGTGLGLVIVKNLVELMGGSISVVSEVDKGTEFTLYLNFPLSSEKEVETVKDVSKIKLPSGLRILLCEDHPLNAQILIKLMDKYGAKVDWKENGKLGVEAFADSEIGYYDLVLMDIRMPVMDGLTAAKTIRARNRPDGKNVPIIAMTANAYDEDVQKTFDAGMNAHITKPFEPEKMYAILSECMEKNRELIYKRRGC